MTEERNTTLTENALRKKKSRYGYIGILVFIAIVGGLMIGGFDNNEITKDMKKQTDAYLTQSEFEYLVYLFNSSECDNCNDYKKDLKKYRKSANSLPIYFVKSGSLTNLVVEDELFIDARYPTLIHIKNGEEVNRYVGTFPIKELPRSAKLKGN